MPARPPAARDPRLGALLLFALAGALGAWGGWRLDRSLSPVEARPCGEAGALVAPRVRVTGCELRLLDATRELEAGRVVGAWVPARPPGSAGPAPLLVELRDPALLAALDAASQAAVAGPDALAAWAETAPLPLRLTADLHGELRRGWVRSATDRRHLAHQGEAVAPGAPVLVHGHHPSRRRALGALVLALSTALLGALAWRHPRHAITRGSAPDRPPAERPDGAPETG